MQKQQQYTHTNVNQNQRNKGTDKRPLGAPKVYDSPAHLCHLYKFFNSLNVGYICLIVLYIFPC